MNVAPEINMIIYSSVAFFILLILLWRFAFPPIVNMLEKRTETIRQSLEAAERTRVEAQELLEEYKKQLAAAREEAQSIIEQGRKFGESMKEEIMQKAKHESEEMIRRASEEITREREQALSELQSRIADLTIKAASRVVEKSLDEKEHLRLIEDYLSEVGSLHED